MWLQHLSTGLTWPHKFFEHLAQRPDLDNRLRQEFLQLRVLDLLQPLGVADAKLRAAVVEGRIIYPVLPAQLGSAQPRLVLLQDADDLLWPKPSSLHVSLLR